MSLREDIYRIVVVCVHRHRHVVLLRLPLEYHPASAPTTASGTTAASAACCPCRVTRRPGGSNQSRARPASPCLHRLGRWDMEDVGAGRQRSRCAAGGTAHRRVSGFRWRSQVCFGVGVACSNVGALGSARAGRAASGAGEHSLFKQRC